MTGGGVGASASVQYRFVVTQMVVGSPEGDTADQVGQPAKLRLFPTPEGRAFFGWSAAIYVVITIVLLARTLRVTGGRMIYALDDPAIHLSIATNLVDHGTWGVVPGHFESASSSPLWTVLLSVIIGIFPFAADYAALILNAGAALAILALLARIQGTFHPSRKRPLDVLATAVVTAVVLFLPGATFVGMEHLLHLVLVLAAVHGLLNPSGPDASPLRRLAPYGLLALAALTRLETGFVALALGIALLALCVRRDDGREVPAWRDQFRRIVPVGVAAGLPIVAFSAFNQAMGQGFLPNSVMAKSTALDGGTRIPDLENILNRFTTDPVLSFVAVVCVILAVIAWPQRRPWFVPATTMVLVTLLHVTFAQVGWYERYQVYLLGLGVYTVMLAARDLLPRPHDAQVRMRLAPLLVLPLLLLSFTKISLTVEVPKAANDTYQQRYQAGVFLERYYHQRPVATGELGYISLTHEGPITDLFGLGDYEVLQARREAGGRPRKDYWLGLSRDRGFQVAAVYPRTLYFDTPDEWILVGTWTIPRQPITAFEKTFQFWATTPEEVAPLRAHMEEFAPELPDGVVTDLNDLAELRAARLMEGSGG